MNKFFNPTNKKFMSIYRFYEIKKKLIENKSYSCWPVCLLANKKEYLTIVYK